MSDSENADILETKRKMRNLFKSAQEAIANLQQQLARLESELKTPEVYTLSAERDALAKEVEAYKNAKPGYYKDSDVAKLEREVERLKAEMKMLSCPSCGSDVNGTNWKSKAEALAKKLENIRALPERAPRCPCFNIANKALRIYDGQ